jgi:hypothetical protein
MTFYAFQAKHKHTIQHVSEEETHKVKESHTNIRKYAIYIYWIICHISTPQVTTKRDMATHNVGERMTSNSRKLFSNSVLEISTAI